MQNRRSALHAAIKQEQQIYGGRLKSSAERLKQDGSDAGRRLRALRAELQMVERKLAIYLHGSESGAGSTGVRSKHQGDGDATTPLSTGDDFGPRAKSVLPSPLQILGLDRQKLEEEAVCSSKEQAREVVATLYRTLYVFTIGFHENVRHTFSTDRMCSMSEVGTTLAGGCSC
eukprot:SAG31_NODE_3409_length_4306_cov_1.917281_5_plen_173_part_00